MTEPTQPEVIGDAEASDALHSPDRELPGARRLVTVPNILSLSRLVLLAPILLLLGRNRSTLALGLMIVAWVTDALDGWFARRLHQVSNLGRVLDHLVDKIWIGTVLVMLVLLRDLPVYIAVAVIGRDLLILAGSLVLMKARGTLVSSDVLGKITGFTFALMIVYYTLNLPALAGWKGWVDSTVTVLIVVSFLNYLSVFFRWMSGFRLPAERDDTSQH
ncbi:MAG TPA: CDP-alcohol phosphatidyltransferase family protein [candidate division WOR-3 bacterium]|uniref:CDP-alcohol phosphatidyltransferase family protein n=1 Tax=candidate division WOR-3 bacterium TaxID=2052148 RepID=A0A7V0T731_UNCW3|nr:CDP-alcohol phosphatidyltransferase family protein [candidate division WOR-3 bacterium]